MQAWRLNQTKDQKVINLRKQLALAEKELHQMELIQGWDEEPEITTLEEQVYTGTLLEIKTKFNEIRFSP